MRFVVLGGVEASEGDRVVVTGGGRQRALLALLLIHARQVVSRDCIIEELWAGEPPPSADQSLDALVSRLRRAFREAGRDDILVTRAPGYVLQADDVDAERFARLVQDGRAALRDADHTRAIDLLEEGLALW